VWTHRTYIQLRRLDSYLFEAHALGLSKKEQTLFRAFGNLLAALPRAKSSNREEAHDVLSGEVPPQTQQ
jgi:hypothetical protein